MIVVYCMIIGVVIKNRYNQNGFFNRNASLLLIIYLQSLAVTKSLKGNMTRGSCEKRDRTQTCIDLEATQWIYSAPVEWEMQFQAFCSTRIKGSAFEAI